MSLLEPLPIPPWFVPFGAFDMPLSATAAL
jgi:hypothetical protein